MEIIISTTSNTPIYEQIEEQIKFKIARGELKEGSKLPSIRHLARCLEVSVITTKNAYTMLEHEGYVETIPSKGVYISKKSSELLKEDVLKKIESHLDNAITLAKLNNISKENLEELINILYEEEENE